MKKLVTTFTAAAGLAMAQSAGTAALGPHPGVTGAAQPQAVPGQLHHTKIGAAGPLLGYIQDANSSGIDPVTGSVASAQVESPLTLASDATRTYLPPRQMYALIERAAGPLSLVRLDRNAPLAGELPATAIPQAIAQADRVFFSPRGDSAVLYSETSAQLQVIPSVTSSSPRVVNVSTASVGAFSDLVVSDDGAVLTVFSPERGILFSQNGEEWRVLATPFAPAAWTFLPQSHSLAIYDAAQRQFAVVRVAETAVLEKTVSAGRAVPERILTTKDGMQLLAVSSDGRTWVVDLEVGTVKAGYKTAQSKNLVVLRDGHTFLLSSGPAVNVMKVLGNGTQQ